ncbi:MAG: DUF4270 domain-containing protein [Bacteroidia bacterium]|nr:DUF4270 domain-containing protein [Bacteroidia bacterium]MCZ2248636.1 DUF4270 domain-containing protein [Bacteroidia bacterium]
MIVLGSCKEKDTLGGNLLPKSDQSVFNDNSALKLVTFTVKEDSVKSDELSNSLLGSYVDPIFGKSTASFISQFFASTNQLDFGSNPIADSVVLSMTYNGYYGKVNKLDGLQKLKIYRISSTIYKDSVYYSAQNPEKYYQESDLLGEYSFLPDPDGKYQSSSAVQKFRLPLSLGQDILNNQSTINSTNLPSFFKGLYFKPENNFQTTGNGAILYFNLVNTETPSKISLYFHNDTSTVVQKFDMNITSDCARINFFKHDRNGIPAINTQLSDTAQGQSQIFIQGMAGYNSKIWFSEIENWKDSVPFVITKAELILPVESSLIDIYGIPSKLLLVEKGTDGQYKSIPDFDLGENYFGGNYYSAEQCYKFNIAVYLQKILSGKETQKGLYLLPIASGIGANRVVLKGSNKIKLNLTYSKN